MGSLPPNATGIPYTIPTIQLPSGEWIMNSMTIAQTLEKLYPEPSLRLESACTATVLALMEEILQCIMVDFVPKVPKRLLAEASLPYWYETREAWFGGKRLEDLETQKGGEQVYEAARPHTRELATLLKQDSSGPFFEGQAPSFADFAWAGWLRFYETLGDDVLQRLIFPDQEVHIALLNACRQWFERDDH